MIPNTTPTPNELYNGEMKKMNDTELRVVLVVTRATLGWVIDKETGMRKEEDWISQKQLKEKTGRSNKAIGLAIQRCINMGWIEARDKEGNFLDTPEKRERKKMIFYRLGNIFLSKLSGEEITPEESGEVLKKSGELNATNLVKKLHPTKEIHTKEIIQKIATPSVASKEINDLIELFKPINPSYERLFANKTQRQALERLVKKFGTEKVKNMIEFLPNIFGKPYAPQITTPYMLEQKLGDLISFINKRSQEKINFIDISKI